MLAQYLNLLFYFAALIIFSYLLDRLWMYSLGRWVYLIFAAPGIMVHELSHYIVCKITGAKVTRVVLISKSGGSVTHGKPKGGVMGQAAVSMAPFIGIPVFLLLLGLIFDYLLGCRIIWDPDLGGNVGDVILKTLEEAFDLIRVNLIELKAWWFLLYLYISASLTVALAPSKQDFRNALWGLAVILGGIFIWVLVLENIHIGWNFPVLNLIFDMIGWVIVVGLVLCLFGLILGLPFLLLKRMRSH